MGKDLLDSIDARQLISLLENILWESFSLKAEIGVELEFYLPGLSKIEQFAELCGCRVIKERGNYQYETNLEYCTDLIKISDKFYRHKNKLTTAASFLNYPIDFSAKPIKDDYGSAAHYHLSLIDVNGYNVFSHSEIIMKAVIAEILELTNNMLYMLINADPDNLTRFVPNFMAPINISWSGNNRTTLIRIPDSTLGNKRIEFRLPAVTTAPEYIIIFLLITILRGLVNKHEPINKIYGNAHDSQYSLTQILTDIIEVKKCFSFSEIIGSMHLKY